jgi:hypothetical protein
MIKEVLGMAALTATLLFVGNLDRQDAEADQSRYCEMVGLWELDADLGIKPEDRNGWPPFKNINCEGE